MDDTRDDLIRMLATRDAACPACGYNLRGSPARTCPECGAAFDEQVLLGRGVRRGGGGAGRNHLTDLLLANGLIGFLAWAYAAPAMIASSRLLLWLAMLLAWLAASAWWAVSTALGGRAWIGASVAGVLLAAIVILAIRA